MSEKKDFWGEKNKSQDGMDSGIKELVLRIVIPAIVIIALIALIKIILAQ